MTKTLDDIIIDAEFASLIPPLSAEERKQLEENIIQHGGARDPLVVWRVAPDNMSEEAQEIASDGGELETLTNEELVKAVVAQKVESGRGWPQSCLVGRGEHWALIETTGHVRGDDAKRSGWRDYDMVCVHTGEVNYDDLKSILIDGHNRLEICRRIGLPFDVREVWFQDRSHAEEWIIRNQFGRRNLSAYVRTQLALRLEETIAARAKANQGKRTDIPQKSAESIKPVETRQEIAKVANVSHDTVAKVKKIDAAEKAGKVDAETIRKLRNQEVSINRVVRDLKEQEANEKRNAQKAEAIVKRKSVDGLYHGDFREIGDKIPDDSVDLIFTDPPYDRKAIELFDGLGEFAARVLRPGGSLIAYVGQIQLPDAVADLSNHLRYWWCCSCYHSGPTLLRMNEYGIVNGWKPMLWFVKETRGDKTTFINDVATGTREKSHHEWQQSEAEARYFIELLTKPDEFVVDPFCGGGTTPVACIALGRKWAAFEIDEANIARASERIAGGRK